MKKEPKGTKKVWEGVRLLYRRPEVALVMTGRLSKEEYKQTYGRLLQRDIDSVVAAVDWAEKMKRLRG